MKKYLDVSEEVRNALLNNKPVVALESTIISHGMPYPKNVETALLDWLSNSDVEETVLNNYDDIINYITKALNDVVLPITNKKIPS